MDNGLLCGDEHYRDSESPIRCNRDLDPQPDGRRHRGAHWYRSEHFGWTWANPTTSKRNQMTVNDAIDVMAREVVADLVDIEAGSRWEMHPDVGQRDWERIVARAHELAKHPDDYAAAYGLLARRAYAACTASNPPCAECRDGHA